VLLLGTAQHVEARQIQHVGSEATFDVATWNIEWFGSTSNGPSDENRQMDNVVDIILESGIDLWSLQEISDTRSFDDLLARLGADWSGSLATNSGQQRIGFVYRTAVVQPRRVEHILESFDYEYAFRPPLLLEAAITLPDTSLVATLITLHMKCCSDTESHSRRTSASSRLKSRLDFLEADDNVIILGDLNDTIRGSITPGKPSPYANFLDDPDRWRILTLPLEDSGTCTFCGGSQTSTIDHILVSNEWFSAASAGTTDRHSSVIQGVSGFLSTTSDHVPVYSRLLPTASGTDVTHPTLPDGHPDSRTGPELAAWPNPARSMLQIRMVEPAGVPLNGSIQVRLVDALGRTVRSWDMDAGDVQASVSVSGLPAGLYLLDAGRAGQRTVVVR
jgi:endonuclease/exonuclease/phosphatase family metal-dependent hydrolase